MKKSYISDILKLSVPEKIQLVEDIWDSIASVPEPLELSKEQEEELDRALKEWEANPNLGSPWEEVIARIRRKAS
jgi:putative addiction module component (TIGR02574 family)